MTTPDVPQTAIETTALTKRFGRTAAVQELNLRISRGTAFGFIGPNGAGKSTTIRMLMGVLRISSGKASILGFDPAQDALPVKQRVGYVPEQQFIHRWMRVYEAVAFCRPFYPTWNDKLCADLLDRFRLAADKRVKHLSKGMLVKLALTLALAHEPELLILDEPMAGLDPIAREEFLDGVLRSVCERERTVLFSSHTLSDVQRMADHVGIIHDGRLIVHATVDELLNRTKRIRAVLVDGHPPAGSPDGTIWQRIHEREWLLTVHGFTTETVPKLQAANQLAHVEVFDLGLEDIFKDFVRGSGVPA